MNKEEKIFAAKQIISEYLPNFNLNNNLVEFEVSANFVFSLADDIVCKVRNFNERQFLKSSREAMMTHFLSSQNISVVPFHEKLPFLPQYCSQKRFVISFRKYVPNKRNFKNITGMGKTLAQLHQTLLNFEPQQYVSFFKNCDNEITKKILTLPTVQEKLFKFQNLNIKKIASLVCNRCLLTLIKLKKAVEIDKSFFIQGQMLHGDFHVTNTLQTSNEILINDLEVPIQGPVEYDLAYFLTDGQNKLYRGPLQHRFLQEYLKHEGRYNQRAIAFFSEINMLEQTLHICPLECVEKKPAFN